MQTDCVILGGGAGGLCAAAALGRRRLHVTVVERLPRVGKKLLATGNGRCNLSNLDMKAAHYGKAAPFVEQMYAVTPPSEVAAFFSSLGLMTAVEDDRVYPRTMAASAVLDVLRMACERTSVTLLTDTEAVALTPSRRGGWSVQLADGSGLFAPHVIAAMGGSAAPSMGTDGTGARLMQSLGHEITPLYPALVQLKCIHPALKGLKGIRTQARLTLLIDGTPAAEEVGELLLTDYGVSGVCVFQLSREVAPALAQKRDVRLSINFLPEVASIRPWLDARIKQLSPVSLLTLTTGVLPRLLAQTIIREARLSPDMDAAMLSVDEKNALCRALSAFPLVVTGTQGFANAQVTRGGVSLADVDPLTMV